METDNIKNNNLKTISSEKNQDETNRLNVDYKYESEKFTKDSLKKFSGDFKRSQMIKKTKIDIEYI